MVPAPPEILLIEDSEFDAELTFKALKVKMPTIQYHHLRDGQEALDYLLRQGPYQGQNHPLPLLVLLDLDIPKVQGEKVLETLKQHPASKAIPVIVLTISTSEAKMQQAYELGANSYIIKPLNYVKYSLIVAEIVNYWLLINDFPNYPKGFQTGII